MSETSDFVLFLGRFHPLVVHLPIGFLFFAFMLELLGRKEKYKGLTNAIPFALLSGFVSALVACILGYMLSLSGDYDEDMLDGHFWFGVFTTFLAFIAWLIRIGKINLPEKNKIKANISALAVIVVLLSVTGHYGGNLTHGSDYLTKYMPFNKKEKKTLAAVEKLEDAGVYDYLVEPILDAKCTSCHNESKKKGGLSLIDSLAIMKGGKGGDALIAGNSAKSEIVKRVLLDPHHDDFMPPEGKTPLTDEEIEILKYWIDDASAGFSTKVASVETSENVAKIASTMLGLEGGHHSTDKIPTLGKVDEAALQEVVNAGFRVSELVFDSNIYAVELPAKTITTSNIAELDVKLQALSKIKDNVLWLYLEDNQVKDEQIKIISQFKNLKKLKLNKNSISDSGVSQISDLELESINLYSTNISKESLSELLKIKTLKRAYIWDTAISKEDVEGLNLEKGAPDFVVGL
ncbi:DUF2231 domain-containing protein [Seonamhaeicola marinus]|uniref:Cytochrome c domain-containing protein n=1 Tax=Seonamhaeicola marinus TaxID=1912246 RepID=A0A5D0IMG2_9FLAO|nr:DUF2231 domain-containing protein [Seonamhaeicola marinus]TYA84201.1 hypothetical protein FUA24_05985 [Seonamhaeicola marinus]